MPVMKGVVLCGGQSNRMGFDKALIEFEATTWVELATKKLTELALSVILSVNDQQYNLYFTRFQQVSVVKDNCSLDIYGPLRGILSIHLQYPADDLLVLACDMPLI